MITHKFGTNSSEFVSVPLDYLSVGIYASRDVIESIWHVRRIFSFLGSRAGLYRARERIIFAVQNLFFIEKYMHLY